MARIFNAATMVAIILAVFELGPPAFIAIPVGLVCGFIYAYFEFGKAQNWSMKQIDWNLKTLAVKILRIMWCTSVCDVILYFLAKANSQFTVLLASLAGMIAFMTFKTFPVAKPIASTTPKPFLSPRTKSKV